MNCVMHEIIKELSLIGILPVLKIDREEDAVAVGRALTRGGLRCVEVTFRTAAARGSIAKMAAECPDMLVGAGTVLTTGQVDEAVAAGARFIVTPGLNPMIVRYCQAKGIPIIPGINDPTGIEQAMARTLRAVLILQRFLQFSSTLPPPNRDSIRRRSSEATLLSNVSNMLTEPASSSSVLRNTVSRTAKTVSVSTLSLQCSMIPRSEL